MKKTTRPLFVVALAALVLTALPAPAKQVGVQASVAQPVMLAGQQKTTYLKVGLTGFEFADAGGERPAVNVAIVLDKSGSMGGEKMARAKDAAKMAIDRLGKDDIVSVVTYDSTVQIVVPATKVSDKAAIFRMIDAIKPGGNTALFAGVAKGAAELRKFREKEFVNRIILVSDGIANVGPDTPGALGELGVSLRKEGISVSTVGLGSGYNEDLMFALADKSDGNHAFAESGEHLAKILDGEFGDVLSVVAQEVLVKIDCEPGVRPVKVLGRDAEISGQTTTVLLNQLYSKQEKYVLLEIEVPEGKAGSARNLAKVEVSYANMATEVTDELSSKVAVRFSDSAKEVVAAEDRDVMIASVMQIGTDNNIWAMKLRDEGNIDKARVVLNENRIFLQGNGATLACDDLVTFGVGNGYQAENLAPKAWGTTRKGMRADQFKNTKQVVSQSYNNIGQPAKQESWSAEEIEQQRKAAAEAAKRLEQIRRTPQKASPRSR